MGDDEIIGDESYAFSTHDDVVAAVHLMEKSVVDNIPKFMWVMQREQLRTAVRNHIEALGQDPANESVMLGALYGAMLAINLESQSSVISVQTILLATVLLDMIENPIDAMSPDIGIIRDMVNNASKRRGSSSKLLQFARMILGAFDG